MLDHGELNIPLAKRGDIDAQIDRYKADQAAAAKQKARAAREQLNADRAAAKVVLDNLPADRLQRIAAKANVSISQARKQLQSIAYWTPKQVLALGGAA